jgi:hypothetical protein
MLGASGSMTRSVAPLNWLVVPLSSVHAAPPFVDSQIP